jgi:hypothetical protein
MTHRCLVRFVHGISQVTLAFWFTRNDSSFDAYAHNKSRSLPHVTPQVDFRDDFFSIIISTFVLAYMIFVWCCLWHLENYKTHP